MYGHKKLNWCPLIKSTETNSAQLCEKSLVTLQSVPYMLNFLLKFTAMSLWFNPTFSMTSQWIILVIKPVTTLSMNCWRIHNLVSKALLYEPIFLFFSPTCELFLQGKNSNTKSGTYFSNNKYSPQTYGLQCIYTICHYISNQIMFKEFSKSNNPWFSYLLLINLTLFKCLCKLMKWNDYYSLRTWCTKSNRIINYLSNGI